LIKKHIAIIRRIPKYFVLKGLKPNMFLTYKNFEKLNRMEDIAVAIAAPMVP
jgi:hypothetical protein